MKYIIFGANISGIAQYKMLKDNRDDVLAFIDKKGTSIYKEIDENTLIYKHEDEIPKEIINDTDCIIVCVGKKEIAEEIKNRLVQKFINLSIKTCYEVKDYEKYYTVEMKKYGEFRKQFNHTLSNIVYEEYINPAFKIKNERPIEYAFALKWIAKIYPENVLDVGTGKTAWPHIVANCGIKTTAIDQIDKYWGEKFDNRHYYVVDDDILNPKINKKFDLITCISVLEHIPEYDLAIKNMISLLNSKGILVLTFPYNEKKYIHNAYELATSSYGGPEYAKKINYIGQCFSRNEINQWLTNNSCILLEEELYEVFDGMYWSEGKKLKIPRKVTKKENHNLMCIAIQKN